MCSGSEAGSYLKLIDFVSYSTLGVRLTKKKKKKKKVQGSRFKVQGPGLKVQDPGFKVRFRVQDSGFQAWIQGSSVQLSDVEPSTLNFQP